MEGTTTTDSISNEAVRIRTPGRRRLSEESPVETSRITKIPDVWLDEFPGPVKLSKHDKAPALKFLDENERCVRGFKGYRTVRATHGVISGSWYFEVQLENWQGDGAVRCGWSTRRSEVETPVGFKHGFGIRDRTGEFLVDARREEYGEAFSSGDIIGCLIVLPALSNKDKERVNAFEKDWIEYKFLVKTKPPEGPGIRFDKAYCEFFKNGKSFGIPDHFYKNPESGIEGAKPDGGMKGERYFPALSLFENAVASVNFGPDFKFDIPENARPFCEAAPPPKPIPQPEDVVPETVPEPMEMNGSPMGSADVHTTVHPPPSS